MDLICEERPSDSPFIERVWRSHSENAGDFISMASPNWEMVITRHRGKNTLTLRGPETKATMAYCPPDAEWVGIQFKLGAFMPKFPAKMLMDRQDVDLPEANSQAFWLNGAAWQFFDYDNAEVFVKRLVRESLLVHDPLVESVFAGHPLELSLRTAQRRFLQATGLTQGTMYQINRARRAVALLRQGVSILDTVYQTGYADQPHLTRALKQLIGQTPGQLVDQNRSERLSLLFKTELLSSDIVQVFDSEYREKANEKNSRKLVHITGRHHGIA